MFRRVDPGGWTSATPGSLEGIISLLLTWSFRRGISLAEFRVFSVGAAGRAAHRRAAVLTVSYLYRWKVLEFRWGSGRDVLLSSSFTIREELEEDNSWGVVNTGSRD